MRWRASTYDAPLMCCCSSIGGRGGGGLDVFMAKSFDREVSRRTCRTPGSSGILILVFMCIRYV